MKKIIVGLSLLAFAVSARAVNPITGFGEVDWSSSWTSFDERYLEDHFEVGLRITHWTLSDPSKGIYNAEGTFIGGFAEGISTDDLSVQQDYLPSLFLRYKFIPYLGLELGLEKLRAETSTYWDGHTNGDVVMRGPSLSLVGQYPNDTIFTPYAGIGLAFLNGNFEEDGKWHRASGYTRNMEAGDVTATLLTLGCSIQIVESLEADISFRSMSNADSDAKYYLRWNDGGISNTAKFTWPLDATSFQIGVKYLF